MLLNIRNLYADLTQVSTNPNGSPTKPVYFYATVKNLLDFGEKQDMAKIHDVPGRLRVQYKRLRNNPDALAMLSQALKREGVYKIKSNALTGSLVVCYDNLTVRSEQLLDVLNENGFPANLRKARRIRRESRKNGEVAVKVGKATASWVAGQVLEANGFGLIAAMI